MLNPQDLGLDKFDEFRPAQLEAISFVLGSSKPYVALCLPGGSGKSLVAVALAKLFDARTVILTSTKGLQDQYLRDFGLIRTAARVLSRLGQRPRGVMVDIRGKANYHCAEHDVSCADGERMGCRRFGTSSCEYSDALAIAASSELVVTNYAMWMSAGESFRENVDLLILDEAHLAPEELARHLEVVIAQEDLESLEDESGVPFWTECPRSENPRAWDSYASWFGRTAKSLADGRRAQIRERGLLDGDIEFIRQCDALREKLANIRLYAAYAVVDQERLRRQTLWRFNPIEPGHFAQAKLLAPVAPAQKTVLMSSTITPKTLSLLNLKPDRYEFREWPRVFPANRCPVYHLPTVRLNHRTSESDLRRWLEQIDRIIESRLDRKGIIHTVSYQRQQYLLANSRFSQYFLANTTDPDSPSAAEVVEQFRGRSAPAILVSPSFSTGWDFPYEQAEWQIITKIPFPPVVSKVMKARVERDKSYPSYLAMQELVQASCRGMRSADDRCETFIIDDNIAWFLHQNRKFAPAWFQVRKVASLPKPPQRVKSPAKCS